MSSQHKIRLHRQSPFAAIFGSARTSSAQFCPRPSSHDPVPFLRVDELRKMRYGFMGKNANRRLRRKRSDVGGCFIRQ
ncbi:hypothetical protein Q2T83_17980 [Fervidibacter sacchari]|uniref:Uncharacterized protein n=1 Tax=Candidatus Fervidibacter sacchari TaxID=1448929 RepID=A0ABT2ELS8_9BACT|nr:hypothetical protein [Candidatus Fervidibacter sacchari]MCS3918416.1 hypothetical protein [Candidatus Fervidibacter sacchari]WKU16200.1 hypothetical protein Q2T83_17980 [Candidatus Fervidibacter sacchari]